MTVEKSNFNIYLIQVENFAIMGLIRLFAMTEFTTKIRDKNLPDKEVKHSRAVVVQSCTFLFGTMLSEPEACIHSCLLSSHMTQESVPAPRRHHRCLSAGRWRLVPQQQEDFLCFQESVAVPTPHTLLCSWNEKLTCFFSLFKKEASGFLTTWGWESAVCQSQVRLQL